MSERGGGAVVVFTDLLASAAKLPGVRIDREKYLRISLRNLVDEETIRKAVAHTPADAGIPLDIIDKIAKESIKFEATRVTALSAAAGVPGLLALPATMPVDMAQYLGHMLRISQKLAYLYSWPDLFEERSVEADDGTQAVLTLFVGVMFGAQSANLAVSKLSIMLSEQVARKLPEKALTQGVIYPLVKKVAALLGQQMTKQVFARGVSKAVPVIGAVVSGGVTLASFLPMANRLKKHLSSLVRDRPKRYDVSLPMPSTEENLALEHSATYEQKD
ncbi:MAG: hypothetical protein Q4G30_04375 [Actinomycetaceae bacterium]|nr:hypothetical protein [Actinomycetaceae bacterium]